MRKHLSKKRVVLAAIVVVALAIASGVAYAYFTATGAGTAGWREHGELINTDSVSISENQ